MKKYVFLFASFWLLSCQTQVSIENIQEPPLFNKMDTTFANVYQPLDGTWKGTFKIYNDTVLGPIKDQLLNNPSLSTLEELQLKLADTIMVTQVYESLSPYFQTVNITDYYPNQDKTVKSKGVNKVQDGKMWCVVIKPDDMVIHAGSTDDPQTIIWQRNRKEPLSKEYFRETVLESTYEIIGWGYYGNADTTQMPPYWFYSKYIRQ